MRYRFVRCLAGSVAKWTWMTLDQIANLKHKKFKAKIGSTDSENWRITDLTSLEVDEWLLDYVIESSNVKEPDFYTSADIADAKP